MAQNIYDRPDFFAGYSRLPRSVHGLDGAPEWPAVQRMLPSLAGARIVDLGCGFGWFARWARSQGAAEVLAIDLSDNMLGRARAATTDDAIRYLRADLESLALPEKSFDLAYSALAFHYVDDFGRLVRCIHQALAPGGCLVFTIEHPIYMAPSRPDWMQADADRRVWPLDGYAQEGRRVTDWLAKGVVKYHRRLDTTINQLIEAGFTLDGIEEWNPTPDQLAAIPTLRDEMDRPMMLLVAARA